MVASHFVGKSKAVLGMVDLRNLLGGEIIPNSDIHSLPRKFPHVYGGLDGAARSNEGVDETMDRIHY